MIYLEILMLSILLYTCVYVTITDFKIGIIENKRLLMAAIPSIAINIIYYSWFANEYISFYILNIIIVAFISILLYANHIWSAGDSKLLIFILINIPYRLYYSKGENIAPCIILIVIIFSIAYIYVIAETIFLGFKQKNLLRLSSIRFNIIEFIKTYIQATIYITLFNQLFLLIFPAFYKQNLSLVMFANIFIAMQIFKNKKAQMLMSQAIGLILIGIITFFDGFSGFMSFDIRTFVILAVLILFRLIAEKYNYVEVKAEDVCSGMVLSYLSVTKFATSKISGLPKFTTEDLRTKITSEEVESIKKWAKSKKGSSTILIVRKLPFAIFITSGTILFILIGVYVK